jgi:hypothetical chaperone protein
MNAVGYGIDFGTTNSAISIAYPDAVEVVSAEPRAQLDTMLPSMVYLHRNALRLAGTQAAETFMVTGRDRHRCSACPLVIVANGLAETHCHTYSRGGGCMDSRLLAGLKLDLADESFQRTHSWATDFRVEELVATTLRRLKKLADEECGQDVRRAVFGFPLAFPGTEGSRYPQLQGMAWHRLVQAARQAGFDEIQQLAEPQAAAIVEDADEGTVLAVDFGGGTFDTAVIEFGADTAEVTALQGAAVGGELIDAAIFRTKVADALGLHATFAGQSEAALSMPAWMQRRFQTLAGIKHLVADNDVGVWLREHAAMPGGAPLTQLSELLYGGQAYSFYRTIEQAKIDLSVAQETSISFHRHGIDVELDFSRKELDAVAEPFLTQIDECIDRAVRQAGITDHELSYVVTTGGSSQLGAFQALLSDRFGGHRIKVRDPYNTVVTGLGYDAQSRWAG